MKERRIVITGMGAVSCGGNSVQELWETLSHGRSGIRQISLFEPDPKLPVTIAGEVRDLVVPGMTVKEERRTARFTRFAIAAAHEALTQAKLLDAETAKITLPDPFRAGALISSGAGGVEVYDKNAAALARGSGLSAFFVPSYITNTASGSVAIRFGLKGPNFSVSSACASSSHAIGEAFWQIKRGDADLMLAGGSETCVTRLLTGGFAALTALSLQNGEPEKACKPFDLNRDGFVIAEGAALLVLEELEHAKQRGATILAELIGYGATCDAWHITSPDPEGTGDIRAMQMAIAHAGCRPEDITCISAHGTGTTANDKCETKAIRAVFGAHADKIAVSAVKSMIGHALGAAGALAAVACVKTAETGLVPPTINYTTPDPECDLDVTPNTARQADPEFILSNSLGFGGHNAALIFKKYTE